MSREARAAAPGICLVAALADNRVIGRDGTMPWHLREDLRHFRRLTIDRAVVMGRRTHESIGRVLDRRLNLVLSRRVGLRIEGCEVVPDLDAAIAAAVRAGHRELMVIGGAEIYALALPRAERMELTLIHAEIAGDTRFPDYDPHSWRETARDARPPDPESGLRYSFVTLERVAADRRQG